MNYKLKNFIQLIISLNIAFISTLSITQNNIKLGKLSLDLVSLYCKVDLIHCIFFPYHHPNPIRWITVMLHHVFVIFGVLYMPPIYTMFLNKTLLIEYSSAALSLHRIIKNKYTKIIFFTTWLLTRLILLGFQTYIFPINKIDSYLVIISWHSIPILSLFWTLESLSALPSFFKLEWSFFNEKIYKTQKSQIHIWFIIFYSCIKSK